MTTWSDPNVSPIQCDWSSVKLPAVQGRSMIERGFSLKGKCVATHGMF